MTKCEATNCEETKGVTRILVEGAVDNLLAWGYVCPAHRKKLVASLKRLGISKTRKRQKSLTAAKKPLKVDFYLKDKKGKKAFKK